MKKLIIFLVTIIITGCASKPISLKPDDLTEITEIALVTTKPASKYTVVPHVSNEAAFAVGFLTGGIGAIIFATSFGAVIQVKSTAFTNKITDEKPNKAKLAIQSLLTQVADTELKIVPIQFTLQDKEINYITANITADIFKELNIKQKVIVQLSIDEVGYIDDGGGYSPYIRARALMFKKGQAEPIYKHLFVTNNPGLDIYTALEFSDDIYGEYEYESLDELFKDANNAHKDLLEIIKQVGKKVANDLLVAKGLEIPVKIKNPIKLSTDNSLEKTGDLP